MSFNSAFAKTPIIPKVYVITGTTSGIGKVVGEAKSKLHNKSYTLSPSHLPPLLSLQFALCAP